MERLPTLTPPDLCNLACCLSLTAGAAADQRSGATAAAARADRAMAALRRAVAGGFRNVAQMRADTDLDALRSRDDFRLLLMDAAFPAEPLAQ
jgi:eukaryotic-like serine/threonine-protein kinase